MVYNRFDEHFWGPAGPDVIEKRLNQGSESNRLFCYFLEEFAVVEEVYARGLSKLLKSTAPLVEFGTLRDCWLAIRGEVENLAKIHHDLGNALRKDMGTPLNKFKDDQGKTRRQHLADAWKLNKERKNLESNVTRLRERYEEYAKKAEAAQQKVEQAKSANKPQSEISKLTTSAQKYAKEEMLFEHEYKESILKLTAFQPTWEEKTAGIYQQLQQQEEERIEYTKAILEKYVQALEVNAPYQVDACKRMKEKTKLIDKNEDISCFIRENQTGTEKPAVTSFVPYRGGGGGGLSSGYSSANLSSPTSFTNTPTKPTQSTSSSSGPGKLNGKPVVKAGGRKVTALYDYVGTDASELDFLAGDSIVVKEEDESGWWTGEIDGRVGLFPSNYVE